MENENNTSSIKMNDNGLPSSIVSLDRNMEQLGLQGTSDANVKESTLVESDKENIVPTDMNALNSMSPSQVKSSANITLRQSTRKMNTLETTFQSACSKGLEVDTIFLFERFQQTAVTMENENNTSSVKMHDNGLPSSIVSLDRNMEQLGLQGTSDANVKESTLVESDKENIVPAHMNALNSMSPSQVKSSANITLRQSARKMNTLETTFQSDLNTTTSILQDKENRVPGNNCGPDVQRYLSPSFAKETSKTPRPALRRSTRKSTVEKTRQTEASVTARALKSKDNRMPYNDAQSLFSPSFTKESTSTTNVLGNEKEESNSPRSSLRKTARVLNVKEEEMNKSQAIAAAYALLENKGTPVTKTSTTALFEKHIQPIPLCMSALIAAGSKSPSNVQSADQEATTPSFVMMPESLHEEWFNKLINKSDMFSPTISYNFKQKSSIIETDDFDLAASKVHPVSSPCDDFSQLTNPSPPKLLNPDAVAFIPGIVSSVPVVTDQSHCPEPPLEWKRLYFNRPLPSSTDEEKWAWLEDIIGFIQNASPRETMISPIQRMRPLPATPAIGTHPRGAFSTTAKTKGQPMLG